eukprot:scaffold67693_cov45-Attheya_sp.AAC.1
MCLARAAIHLGLAYDVGNKTLILLWRQAHIQISRDMVRRCCCLDGRRKYARGVTEKDSKISWSCRATESPSHPPHESHQYEYRE